MNPHELITKLVPVVYEDDLLLAVVKPSGVDTGGRDSGGRVGGPLGLVEILAAIGHSGEPLQPVNRLSRYESGVLLLGKDAEAVRFVRRALNASRVRQEYDAVVQGTMRRPRLTIQTGSSPTSTTETGSRRSARLAKSAARQKTKTGKHRPPLSQDAKSVSPTTLTRIQHGEGHTLVRCCTTAGTTHALRAQLRGEGMRLLGDKLHLYRPPHVRGKPTQGRSARGRSTQTHPRRPPQVGLDPAAGVERTCLHLRKLSFVGPKDRIRITASARQAPHLKAGLSGESDIRRALHAALVRRLPCLLDEKTNAFRLITGHVEDAPGLVVEQYGPVVLLQVQEGSPTELAGKWPTIARWYAKTLGADSVCVKQIIKDRSTAATNERSGLSMPKQLIGDEVPEQIDILENGLKLAVRLREGFSVGLFLDQRDNRNRVRALAAEKDVLNLFAYTCAFSVAAAAGDARHTTSVDISPKHLERGRLNFALNDIDLANHTFIRSTAMDYCKRALRQKKRFDLIVIDPPTFARGRRGADTFSVVNDLPTLVGRAVALLRPGGHLMVSTNHRRMSMAGLREQVKRGARDRRFEIVDAPPLPLDFASDPQHAKTVLGRLAD